MERIDDLQYNGLKLIQDTELFCFGCDAVELANFAAQKRAKRVCDLGCGTGIIPILLAGKTDSSVVGVEIQQRAAALAERNAALNNMSERISIFCTAMQQFAAENKNIGAFDAVTCNPPYRKAGSGEKQSSVAIAVARHEIEVTLSEVVASAAKLLKSGGRFYTVGQTERLAETISLCVSCALEPKVLQILTPSDKKDPHLFLLECLKDGKTGLKVLKERTVDTTC